MTRTLVYTKVRGLTPEQIRLGIKMKAEMRYKARRRREEIRDWDEACRQVKKEKADPTDDDIRPVAQSIYLYRLQSELIHDFNTAIGRLVQAGIPYPSEEEIRAEMSRVYHDRLEQSQLEDWLEAEESAKWCGCVWLPLDEVK